VKLFALVAFAFCASSLVAQSRDSTGAAARPAVLTGIVNDALGDPIPGVEARIQPGDLAVRTDSAGRYRVEAPPGEYNITFRRLGYAAEDFSWRARPGVSTTLSLRLDLVPHGLDTIVVRDSHDRIAGNSSISGVVIDSLLRPLQDVELQLMGTGRHATSYESGTFFFAGLAQGDYVVRARRMGFVPANFSVRVGKDEKHRFRIILEPLPHTLKTIEVTEQSGYGRSATAWEEFDRRQRWKSGLTALITRDDLDRQGKTPLDWALRATRAASLINMSSWFGGGTNINSMMGAAGRRRVEPIPGDVCVLINGVRGSRLPLRWFSANEVESVEVYPAGSDWTGTIGARMGLVKGCEPGDGLSHPAYFVVWMRGAS
jgi:hypothetical protein